MNRVVARASRPFESKRTGETPVPLPRPSPSARRDLYLDSLRGGFHVLMLLDHLPILFPGMLPLFAWVFECAGYVSVAEGFVFLSGYVTGLVYTRVCRESGERALWRKAIVRSFVIYATYIVAVVLLVGLARLGGGAGMQWGGWGGLMDIPMWRASILAAGLLVRPSFLEILPMYSLFLLLTPLALGLLERRNGWFIVLASASLWVAEQMGFFGSLSVGLPTFGFFHPAAWQVLFVGGLFCGHRTRHVSAPWLARDSRLVVLAYGIVVVCFALRHDLFGVEFDSHWTARSQLGPLRLLNFACVVYLAARFRHWIEPRIAWRGLWLLSRNSLQVFAFHLVPVYLVALVVTQRIAVPWPVQLASVALCVGGLFEIAWLAERAKQWRRQQRGAVLQPKAQQPQ